MRSGPGTSKIIVTMWSSRLHSMKLCQSLRALRGVFTSEWRFCAHTWMTDFKQWFCSNLFYIAVCMYTVQFNSLHTICLLIQTKIHGTMYLLWLFQIFFLCWLGLCMFKSPGQWKLHCLVRLENNTRDYFGCTVQAVAAAIPHRKWPELSCEKFPFGTVHKYTHSH